ncbi:MAG: hypothetical protein QNI84_16435 [Henriciella sp.]|nr:hypothetical protein [Henriciella sp.]
MSLIILFTVSGAVMLLAAQAMQHYLPRRHGEIRPTPLWVVFGSGLFAFFGVSSLVFAFSANTPASLFSLALSVGGAAMIAFFFHRRILFKRKALYQVRAGRVDLAVPYSCAWQCQLGENIEREGLIIEGVGARKWAIPGATSRQALSEALWCLSNAGVRLPDETALMQRLGISFAMIRQSAR